ncbi:MAG: GMC family oxidoreductase [Gemmataceae bacterium]|nr:GMC family oxidoreductase [Gemmataceae bacterium]MDW8267380.1 GMC family oxidoreductase [Gemmataceae bacterium]
MTYDCDILVVGSGAGGGTFAAACARAGKEVLLLERGRLMLADPLNHDEQATLLDKIPYDDRPVVVNGTVRRLYIGGVVGGSTALFGAALLRPSRDDFHPGRHYGRRLPRSLWDWPIDYDILEPYYTQAEQLYGVSGSMDDEFGPLAKPRQGFPRQPMPLHPINQRLAAANRAHGLQPFRLPLAIDPARCQLCPACPGYLCPHQARQSSGLVVERVMADGHRLRLLSYWEAERLERGPAGKVVGVQARDRASGASATFRARRYVLAAGAIGSPVLLLRSGIEGELIGRHYMPHLAPIVVGLFSRSIEAETAFVKQLGFSDYYFGTRTRPEKLGLIQSLPVPGPRMLAQAAPRWLRAGLVGYLRPRMLPLAGIVEDLPQPTNRVDLGPDGQPRLRHRFAPYDWERGRRLTRLMARILRRAGARWCIGKPFPSEEHVAHQCGTLRFGRQPDHAVLDPDCRLFGHPNVFVVDGSFFPTSLGVGPALTIMANALRVADVVVREV